MQLVFYGYLFASLFAGTLALQCYQCGQYNEGVGSITPCINQSHMVLKECPSDHHTFCIKYLSEGTIVKDCVPRCTEREDWGTKTFCCKEDGCNSSYSTRSSFFVIITIVLLVSYLSH